MEEWTEILSDYSREEAIKKFEAWKNDNKEISKKLSDYDIRIDTIRTNDKRNLTRYCIKNSVLQNQT